MRKPSRSVVSEVRAALVTGSEAFLSLVPQLLVGIIIFLSGLSLKNLADADERKDFRYYGGILIMILGSALGLGFGGEELIAEFLG